MRYQINDKVFCKIKALTRIQLLCTIIKFVDDCAVVQLPYKMKGLTTATIAIKDIISKQEPPQRAPKTNRPAPPDSPFGKIKERLLQISSARPPEPPRPPRPAEEPPRPPSIQKQASKPNDNCIFSLLNPDDLTPEELKMIKDLGEK